MKPLPGIAGLLAAGLVGLAWAPSVQALECPSPPVQLRQDWNHLVEREVRALGPLKGSGLRTRVRTVTRDLLGRLPGADRVYLEQMMFSAYCTALRADRALSEADKARRVLEYRRELRASLEAAGRR